MMVRRTTGGMHDIVYAAFNMYWEPLEFTLPAPAVGQWRLFANTGAAPPEDIAEPGQEPHLADQKKILIPGRSTVILTAG
jgi:glycogen operon protein